MWLRQLSITNCRVIEQIEVTLSPYANWLIGGNASGKSSFLEALSVLSRGRSFRTPRIQEVIRQDQKALMVAGRIYDTETRTDYPLGITKTAHNTKIRINHADVHQQAELSSYLPLTIIHPDTLEVITGPPSHRRAMLDWVAFYRSVDFHQDWKNYQRVLKQRNACLRDPTQRYALQHWTEQLIRLQPRIHQFRQDALAAMVNAFDSLNPLFTHTGKPELKLYHGFPGNLAVDDEQALSRFFASKKSQEIEQGTSVYGCHRGDVQVLLNQAPAARTASRGQLKMLSIALLLAQSQAITNEQAKRGIIAIDDLASELDTDNQALLYQVLKQTQQQLIVTGTRQPDANYLSETGKMFHVEHGQLTEVTIAH